MKHRSIITTVIFALTIGLIGCAPAPDKKHYTHSDSRAYRVLGIDQPTYFAVDLQDVENYNLFKRVGIRKHCSYWNKVKMHAIYQFKTNYYRTDAGKEVYGPDDDDVARKICDLPPKQK